MNKWRCYVIDERDRIRVPAGEGTEQDAIGILLDEILRLRGMIEGCEHTTSAPQPSGTWKPK